ncbi:Dihydrodipicolinate synthase [Conoideocrella luteorostrata]|uniref:Dihydrodipicolinate synthase n=1 Tax=Conoideocrella luteorostrata TaxID=1105319 RepID=A0AAJ0G1D3_9HYPO|nr:Dihydrodipicolinate synthase [Conoideocrella luteorostrata]
MDYVGHRVVQEAAKETTSATTLFVPINFVLLSVLAYTVYSTFSRSNTTAPVPRGPPPKVFRTYTPRTLLPFNGEDGGPIFFAVRGRVFDVSNGRGFYGPGGPYANFAGRDASRGLSCHSFDTDMLTEDLDGPLDTLEGLGPSEMEALQGWEETFMGKYDIVGKLVSVADDNALRVAEAAQ